MRVVVKGHRGRWDATKQVWIRHSVTVVAFFKSEGQWNIMFVFSATQCEELDYIIWIRTVIKAQATDAAIRWGGNRETKEVDIPWCQRPRQGAVMSVTHKRACDCKHRSEINLKSKESIRFNFIMNVEQFQLLFQLLRTLLFSSRHHIQCQESRSDRHLNIPKLKPVKQMTETFANPSLQIICLLDWHL